MLNKFIEWDQKLNGDDKEKRQQLPVDKQGYLDDIRQTPKDRWANSICVTGFQEEEKQKTLEEMITKTISDLQNDINLQT